VAFLGIGTAYSFYILNNKILPVSVRSRFAFLYKILYNKYYVDEIYEFIFIKPCVSLSRLSFKFDLGIIDGAVNAIAKITVIIGKIKTWIDIYIIDGLVNAVAKIIRLSSGLLRKAQTGLVQNYLLIAFFGLLILIIIKFIKGGICLSQFLPALYFYRF